MKTTLLLAGLVSLALAACGGGSSAASGSTSQAPVASNSGAGHGGAGASGGASSGSVAPLSSEANVASIVVNGGGINLLNAPTISITVCSPGTSQCATVPNVLVDSGSSGLRLMKSALSSLALPSETNPATNDPIAGCTVYAGGVAWGPLATADIRIAGEKAQAVPLQLVDPTYGSVPSSCSNQGSLLTASALGVNGILGVAGYLTDDIPTFDCTKSATTTCAQTYAPSASQKIANVVSRFAADNNGVIISLPAIPAAGVASVSGTLTFGIDTQPNNAIDGVNMVAGISNGLTATYDGRTVPATFDTGSSVGFFANAPFPTCVLTELYSFGTTWYCPATLNAQVASYSGGGLTAAFDFGVANAQLAFAGAKPNAYALPNVAMQADLFNEDLLDVGMAFLFGQNLYLQYPMYGSPTAMIGLQPNGQTSGG